MLTIWTKGLKEGVLQRNMPRQTNQMEVIERWRKVDPVATGVEITPSTLGSDYIANERIEIELTMYDPTFVEPWHTVVAFYKEDDRTPEAKERIWPHQWDCVEGSQWYITEDGVVSQYAPGEKPNVTDPDFWFKEEHYHTSSRHADQAESRPCSGKSDRAGCPRCRADDGRRAGPRVRTIQRRCSTIKVVLTLEGTVTRFDYLNPHSWLYVNVKGDDGSVTEWGFELDAPPRLRRIGISPTFWQPGDEVTLKTNPLRDGRPAGHLVGAVTASGKTFGNVAGLSASP